MVDILALDKWSSGEQLDFRKGSPVQKIRYQHDYPATANGTIGDDQDRRRFVPLLRDWVNLVVSESTRHRISPKILEEVKSSGWLTAYSTQIYQLYRLPTNWDSYGSNPPNLIAVDAACKILDALWDMQVPPSRVAPLADEGIVIWLTLNDHHISIESLNSGEVVLEIDRSDGSFGKVYENKTPSEIQYILDAYIPFLKNAAPADVSWLEGGGSELPSE